MLKIEVVSLYGSEHIPEIGVMVSIWIMGSEGDSLLESQYPYFYQFSLSEPILYPKNEICRATPLRDVLWRVPFAWAICCCNHIC